VDIEGSEGKSVCMVSRFFRKAAHLQHEVRAVKGTYVQVCDALRVNVAQRSHKLFWMPHRYRSLGERASNRRKRKNQNSQKSKFQKLQTQKRKS
jgi:hypothetical protein